ncbi:MAG: hypothetical protein J1F35_06320 [Erysipelotrichales bacterium]|nr:hypothetical protein [Erysipelotrichales bacterium]
MKLTDEKFFNYLEEAFLSTSQMERYEFAVFTADKTDKEFFKFICDSAKTMFTEEKNFFEGNSGPFIYGEDAYKVLAKFDSLIKKDNSKEEANKLIKEYYKFA